MRNLFFLLIILFAYTIANAQDLPTRHLHSRRFGNDSVIIYYNQFYDLIEPDCAKIIRHGHFNSRYEHFYGKFEDVSKDDTTFVVARGSYSNDGLKNGEFITYYLNKVPQAKGYFKNGNYYGPWVFYSINGHILETANFLNGYYNDECMFYNENGSPNTHMKITGYKVEILDAWDHDGKKIVDHGNGDYSFYDGGITWRGEVLNGLPNGIWYFRMSETVYGSEIFKKGKFVSGHNKSPVGDKDYDDKSRIHFIPTVPKLGISRASEFHPFSHSACDTTTYKIENNISKYMIKIFD
jgi:hypothetical protein